MEHYNFGRHLFYLNLGDIISWRSPKELAYAFGKNIYYMKVNPFLYCTVSSFFSDGVILWRSRWRRSCQNRYFSSFYTLYYFCLTFECRSISSHISKKVISVYFVLIISTLLATDFLSGSSNFVIPLQHF